MTEPSRVIFGNIQLGWLVYFLGAALIALIVLAYRRRSKMWHIGGPDTNQAVKMSTRWKAFFKTAIVDFLIHRKFIGYADNLDHRPLKSSDLKPREFVPGFAHFLLAVGFFMLLLGTAADVFSHYIYDFIKGNMYFAHSLFSDAGGLMAVVGLIIFFIRRYAQKPPRLDNKKEDLMALGGLIIVMLTGFLVEGLRQAATEIPLHPDWALWSPGGYVLAKLFGGVSNETLLIWHRVWWWLHAVFTFAFMGYIAWYFNRMWHLGLSPLNVFWRNFGPRGAMVPIDLEKAQSFGVSKVENYTWKNLLDLDACTRCGRCQDNCPANLTGKPLSPKKVIQSLKTNWLEKAPALVKAKAAAPVQPAEGTDASVAESQPVVEAKPMIGGVIETDAIWNCTSCFACQEVCPVCVEPMQKISEMRRNLVMEQAVIPESAEGALRGIEDRGHPWRGTVLTRTSWMEGLNVKSMAEDSAVDVLYWVGCTEALEDRSLKVAQATAKLFNQAGVKFAVLGNEESCCGDPARRLGNEYLFQMQAARNIETLNTYKVKKIVTGCAHCFNTLKNEYPQFGGNFEVVHHSDFIMGLIKEGRLKLPQNLKGTFTYHDPCYIARYNNIYDTPRELLQSVPGLHLNEMERNRERSFCCGAGGGHLWLEEQKVGDRINVARTEQAMAVHAETIATACPYCLQMFQDGIKTKAVEETVKVKDIAEIVLEATGEK
jgi:Fe-S oxidoreductase/nitrate reductase gamma subunit